MNKRRISKVLEYMNQNDVPQMIVSDATAIFYLTGLRVYSGERLLVLYLHVNGVHRLILNELFPLKQEIDVPVVRYNDNQDAVEILDQFIEKGRTIGIDKNWPAMFLLRLQERNPSSKYVNSSSIIDSVRRVKDEEEQVKMRVSSKLNDQVMESLISELKIGKSEKELSEKTKELYLAHGCDGISFYPIIAFSEGAADPHHFPVDACGKQGDCVVMDIGGMKDSYASDMTRTIFLGTVSDRQREIYEIVLEANRRGIAAAKPGNRMCDVDHAARSYIEEKGLGQYFTHRTGHSIGLEVHEAGDVSATNTNVIRVGQCFSVEPGVYIPEEKIGVRIEDLVLITENGCEVLNQFTKDLIVIPNES